MGNDSAIEFKPGAVGEPHSSDPRMFTADGVLITDGLVVMDYNGVACTVDLTKSRITREFWDGWFITSVNSLMNGERLSTVDWRGNKVTLAVLGTPWADGFGVWHVNIATSVGDIDVQRDLARQAIAAAVAQRQADQSPVIRLAPTDMDITRVDTNKVEYRIWSEQ